MLDSSLNHYEELGLTASASSEDIQKAHGTLLRLLRPDQHPDAGLRKAAETQLRRVNAMVGLLLDPEQRRAYDQRLRCRVQPPAILAEPPVPEAPGFPAAPLIGIVIAAVAVTLSAIGLVAGDSIHWKESTSLIPEAATPARSDSARNVLPIPAQWAKRFGPVSAREHSTSTEDRLADPQLAMSVSVPHIASRAPLTVSASSLITGSPAVAAESAPAAGSSLAGMWRLPSYISKRTLSSRFMRAAPQYIQLSIYSEDRIVFGEYAAQYETLDRPISPEVAFRFQGPADGDSAVFNWTASDGSRGGIQLKLLTRQSMQVTWQVTEFGSTMGIAGGAAIVTRKTN